jgi:glycosyltransferase involved in cell wall biosynthesis
MRRHLLDIFHHFRVEKSADMVQINHGGSGSAALLDPRHCEGITKHIGEVYAIERRSGGMSLMASNQIKISLVVPTLGRTVELVKLFKSLADQDRSDFEVIVVDQNTDDRLVPLCAADWPFSVSRIHTPTARGSSRARNAGLKVASGELLLFPDDDCWYPRSFLSRGIELMTAAQVDVLTGRAADEAGNDINGKYSRLPHAITRANVWLSGIEWVMLFKKTALLAVNGFDDDVGVGASTPWQACEAQDILLRALDKGLKCRFDPAFFGHHPRFDDISARAMQAKGRSYGRGHGYVLRVHHCGPVAAANWIGRPVIRMLLSGLSGDIERSRYLFNVALGRLEGYLGRTFALKS